MVSSSKTGKHHDRRDHRFSAKGQVRSARFEAAGIGGIGHGGVAEIHFESESPGDFFAFNFENFCAFAAVKVGHRAVHLIFGVAKPGNQATTICQ